MVYMTVKDRDKRASHNITILGKILRKRGGKPFKVRLDMDDADGRYAKFHYYIFIRNIGDILDYRGILRYADKIDEQKKYRTALMEPM